MERSMSIVGVMRVDVSELINVRCGRHLQNTEE
jgi:hypothetical protein